MLFFSVSRCGETLCQKSIQLLVQGVVCSLVRGRGVGSQSSRSDLLVPGCTRSKQTSWTEDKPDAWGCVQAREVWSTEEEAHLRPGHFWICKFGTVPGRMSCVEKKFDPQTRRWEEYKGTRYYDGDIPRR